jgi:hypothetical protein
MAKNVLRLNTDDQYDYLLVGLVCQHRDYRLCRELNILLEIEMTRQDDYMIFSNKRMEDQGFAFFEFISEEEDQYCLLSNKGPRGLLIPEQKQIDYFMIVRPGRMRLDEAELINKLKEIPLVLAVARIDVKKLKSRENLVL